MKNRLTNKKGITLIALVITIIVLLILAGVSISMVSSQDGILNRATSAKDAQKKATDEEAVRFAVQAALIGGEGTVKASTLNEELGLTGEKEIKSLPTTAEIGGEKYIITKDGEVTNLKNVTKISKTESYVGYYADVDGDGTVDRIIYGDKAVGPEGTRKWKME